jgi:hypothetical protein
MWGYIILFGLFVLGWFLGSTKWGDAMLDKLVRWYDSNF